MTTLELDGYLTEDGELKLEQPIDLPAGKVKVTVESTGNDEATHKAPKPVMTLGDFLNSGLVGTWKDYGITDSAAWVNELRRNEEEKRNPWTH